MRQFTRPVDCPTVAKSLAPEDMRVGDYVAPLAVEREWICDCGDSVNQPRKVRLWVRPCEPETPFHVVAVCLPFVLVRTPKGKPLTLDVRESRLARLDPEFSRVASAAIRDHKDDD